MWRDPRKRQGMNTLVIHEIQQQGPYILIPSLHVGGANSEFRLTRGIIPLDNGLVIRHVEVIKSFLQGLLDIVIKYSKTVSDDVVAPMREAHIVQKLFLQKQTIACEWKCLCFLQRERLHNYRNEWLVFSYLLLHTLSINNQLLKWKQCAMH